MLEEQYMHLIFNVLGTVVFLIFLTSQLKFVTSIDATDVARQIANTHTY